MVGHKTTGSRLSNYEIRWIPVDKVRFDPAMNPRRVTPPPEMIQGMRESGPERTPPPIFYINPDSSLYMVSAVNGWQRAQAAKILGWDEMRARVTDSKVTAQLLSIIEDKRTPETDFQKYRRFYFGFSSLCEEEGLSREEAIREVNKAEGFIRLGVGERRVLIFERLPPEALALMKDRENRTEDELNILKNYIPDIRRRRSKLGIGAGAKIARMLSYRGKHDVVMTACLCLGMTRSDALDFVSRVALDPEMSPVRVFSEYYRKTPKEEIRMNLVVTRVEKIRLDKFREETHSKSWEGLVGKCLGVCYENFVGGTLWEPGVEV